MKRKFKFAPIRELLGPTNYLRAPIQPFLPVDRDTIPHEVTHIDSATRLRLLEEKSRFGKINGAIMDQRKTTQMANCVPILTHMDADDNSGFDVGKLDDPGSPQFVTSIARYMPARHMTASKTHGLEARTAAASLS